MKLLEVGNSPRWYCAFAATGYDGGASDLVGEDESLPLQQAAAPPWQAKACPTMRWNG